MIERDRASRSILCVCGGCGAHQLVGNDAQAAAWEAHHLEAHRLVAIELEREARRRAVAAAAARRRRHAE